VRGRAVLLVAALICFGACSGSGSPPKPAVAPFARVHLTTQAITGVGSAVANASGQRVLYVSVHEKNGNVTCDTKCLSVWPLLLVQPGGKVTADSTLTAKIGRVNVPKFGTAVTYAGYPLHYYAGDTNDSQGSATGQGFEQQWSVITPEGNPTLSTTTSST
jgi:predicted lipoprotein with Yx(FWY)xxD motif